MRGQLGPSSGASAWPDPRIRPIVLTRRSPWVWRCSAAPRSRMRRPRCRGEVRPRVRFPSTPIRPRPDPASVGGRADFDLQLRGVQDHRLQASVEGGGVAARRRSSSRSWRNAASPGPVARRADDHHLDAQRPAASVWNSVCPTSSSARLSQVDPPCSRRSRPRLTNTLSQSAKLTAILTPFSPPSNCMSAARRAASSVDTVPATSGRLAWSAPVSNLRNDTGRAFADVTWKPAGRAS